MRGPTSITIILICFLLTFILALPKYLIAKKKVFVFFYEDNFLNRYVAWAAWADQGLTGLPVFNTSPRLLTVSEVTPGFIGILQVILIQNV